MRMTMMMSNQHYKLGKYCLYSGNVTKQALHWNPQGKRNRGRPKTTEQRAVEKTCT